MLTFDGRLEVLDDDSRREGEQSLKKDLQFKTPASVTPRPLSVLGPHWLGGAAIGQREDIGGILAEERS
jgi:hypothetical protein